MVTMARFMNFFWKRRETRQFHRFFSRYTDRTLIIHRGLSVDWLDELFKTGGAAGHFRFDASTPLSKQPTPIEWLVHQFLLPLNMPLPILCDVGDNYIAVRHLIHKGRLCHPADMGWILEDMRIRHRRHFCLFYKETEMIVQQEMSPDDNDYEINFDSTL